MKKMIGFYLLLLALAITVGCGKNEYPEFKKGTASLSAPSAAAIVKSGLSVDVVFNGANTSVVFDSDQVEGATLSPMMNGPFTVVFSARKSVAGKWVPLDPGSYSFTVSANGNASLTATGQVKVWPNPVLNEGKDLTISGPADLMEFLNGDGIEYALDNGATISWSFTNDDEDVDIGSIDAETGLFTPAEDDETGEVVEGSGTVTVTITNTAADNPYVVTATINIIVGASGNKRPSEFDGYDPYDTMFDASFSVITGTSKGRWAIREASPMWAALEALGIPENAYVYQAFSYATFATLTVPASIDGYGTAKPSAEIPNLKPGEWSTYEGEYVTYVIIIPKYVRPSEFDGYDPYDTMFDASFSVVPGTSNGEWGIRAPSPMWAALEALGIPENAYVYQAFSYATFATLTVPASIYGYGTPKPSAEISTLSYGEWSTYEGEYVTYVIIIPSGVFDD